MKYPFVVILFIISNALYSQSAVKESPLNTIENNPFFHNYNIENFYLHTNKSLYFTEERVFFKAYVVNEANNKPNLDTKNLHVNIYAFNNQLILSKLFYTENGVSSGSIALPKDLESGEYTIQLDTQWNKNFKEGSNFTIQIHNLKDSKTMTSFLENEETEDHQNQSEDINEDSITFFPESGSLLEDIENTIFFNIKSDDQAQITGKIIDINTEQEVAKIENRNSTSAKSTFNYNSNFIAVFNIDGKTQKIELPSANPTGFILTKTNTKQDNTVNFKLKTNAKTLANTDNKFTYAVLHQKGIVNATAPFNLSESILTYNLNFLKTDLFNGLNTVSVFDSQNKLITERSFYNKDKTQGDILTSIINQNKDSITLDLSLINVNKATNISISVLHEDSKAIDYKSKIQNTINKEYTALKDNQTSSFSYKKIKNKPLLFENEKGLIIKGTLNSNIKKPKDYKVILVSPKNNILLSRALNSDKTFEFKNVYFAHPSEYSLTLLDKENKIIKADFYVYNTFINYNADSTIIKPKKLKASKNKVLQENIVYKNTELPQQKNIEILDEVVLDNIEKIKEEKIKKILKENPIIALNKGFSNYYLIDINKNHESLESYLRKLPGLDIKYFNGETYVYLQRKSELAKITLDGSPISQSRGFSLANQSVNSFELITVKISELGYQGTFSGNVNLISRKDYSKLKIKNSDVKQHKTNTGFNFNATTLNDSNLFYPIKQTEKEYSTIDWIPDFTLNPNTTNILKIKKPIDEHVKLIIQGISLDGDLIYKIIQL
ncbi:DUF4397 domain-containing protein [Olleya namhaensis]|nr:DUF4397 domain-containing protein [Olleya namhaensis]